MPSEPLRDEAGSRRLWAAFVALVGLSGATVALQGGASLPVTVLSTLGGLLAGLALVAYLRRVA